MSVFYFMGSFGCGELSKKSCLVERDFLVEGYFPFFFPLQIPPCVHGFMAQDNLTERMKRIFENRRRNVALKQLRKEWERLKHEE